MKNLENKIKDSIKTNVGRLEIYNLFRKYEDLFAQIKNPTPEQQSNYIELYSEYMHYLNRGGKWN